MSQNLGQDNIPYPGHSGLPRETIVCETEHQRIPRLKTSEPWPHLILFPTVGNDSLKVYPVPDSRPCVYVYCPAGFSNQVYKVGAQPIRKLRIRKVSFALLCPRLRLVSTILLVNFLPMSSWCPNLCS